MGLFLRPHRLSLTVAAPALQADTRIVLPRSDADAQRILQGRVEPIAASLADGIAGIVGAVGYNVFVNPEDAGYLPVGTLFYWQEADMWLRVVGPPALRAVGRQTEHAVIEAQRDEPAPVGRQIG